MTKKLHHVMPSWASLDEYKRTLTTLELFDEGMQYTDTKSLKITFLTECLSRLIDELDVDTSTVLRILELENAFDEVKYG